MQTLQIEDLRLPSSRARLRETNTLSTKPDYHLQRPLYLLSRHFASLQERKSFYMLLASVYKALRRKFNVGYYIIARA